MNNDNNDCDDDDNDKDDNDIDDNNNCTIDAHGVRWYEDRMHW